MNRNSAIRLALVSGLTLFAGIATTQQSGGIKDVSEFEARKIAADVEKWPGAAVYRQSCAGCHEGQVPKAPHKMFLQMLTGPTILHALTEGLMKPQGHALTPRQRK